MRNLSRITNYTNRMEALRDWSKLAKEADKSGMMDLVCRYAPKGNAGWRKIDQATSNLRRAMLERRGEISA